MQKDPKRVLESLRVEEEDPLLHHRPRKFRKRKNELSQVSNTAILSLCLVTGLSSGVGSAFANTQDGNPQNKAPLDEPPSKVELDKEVKLPQMKVPQTNSSEITPSNPPLDEPASDVTDQQQPENSKNNQEHIEKGNGESSKQVQKQQTTETKRKKEQSDTVKDETKSKQKVEQPKKEEKAPQKEQKNNPVNKEEAEKSTSSKQMKQENVNNKVPPADSSTPSDKQEQKIEEEAKNTNNESINQSLDVLLPETEEGGELPETAGNDLNQVALGAGIALAGVVLLKRKREQS